MRTSRSAGCGIDNVDIHIDAEEVPILDGCAETFVREFLAVGVQEQHEPKQTWVVDQVYWDTRGDQLLGVLPSDGCEIMYILDYPDAFFKPQMVHLTFNPDTLQDTYIQTIAPARTYGFEHEVQALLDQGLAKGGSLDNALVIGDTDFLSPLKMPNELAMHKVLDIMGDFAILGRPIQGTIVGIRSGHQLNSEMVKRLGSVMG